MFFTSISTLIVWHSIAASFRVTSICMNGSRCETDGNIGVCGGRWTDLGEYAKPLDLLSWGSDKAIATCRVFRDIHPRMKRLSQSGETLGLALLDDVPAPQSVTDVAGASEFGLWKAYAELLVRTYVVRERVSWRRVELRCWSSLVHHCINSGYVVWGIVGLDSSSKAW